MLIVHLQRESVMHIQQHIVEQQQVAHINTEMPHMKQMDGMTMTPTLWIRAALSSGVVVSISMGLTLEYSTSTTAMGAVTAATVSVYVSQYSNAKSVIERY